MKTNLVRNWRWMVAVVGLSLAGFLPGVAALEKSPASPADKPEAEESAPKPDDSAPPPASPAKVTREPIVMFGQDAVLKANETVETVVVIGGSARIEGKVTDAAVVIGGNLDITGEVGDAAVAVMGAIKLGPTAKVRGDVVSVGGTVDKADGASIGGQLVPVTIPGLKLPELKWLKLWLTQCVFKFRPLAPQVGWVWAVAGVFFLFYLLIALAFPGAVQACLGEIERQPATTFLVGLLTKLLLPFVIGVLAITGIGLLGVPFLLVAWVLALALGKVALLEYFGRQIGRGFKSTALQAPLPAFFVGTLLLTVLYLVPVLGLITYAFSSIWAVGAAVMAVVGKSRREAPTPAPTTVLPLPTTGPAAVPPTIGGPVPAPDVAGAAPALPSTPPPLTPAAVVAGPPEALAYPRASFWRRLGGVLLDTLLVSIVCGMTGLLNHGPFMFFLAGVAYFTAMWAWKGTTIGGVVSGTKVVRLDGQPLTWQVALVRALMALFGVMVCFLGFLWIAFDRERQGWHDKIAGTVVVRLPRGVPLLVL